VVEALLTSGLLTGNEVFSDSFIIEHRTGRNALTLFKTFQQTLALEYGYGPVNKKAKVDNEKLKIAPVGDRAAKLVNVDWDTINEKRDDWTKRWNREVER